MRILILEDDPIIAMDLKKICAGEMHEAKSISRNFGETFSVFSEFNPHLLICDFRLTDTLTSAQLLDPILATASVHIIFITAYYDPTTIDEINRFTPDGFLIKPFRSEQVVALIRRVVQLLSNREGVITKLGISPRELEILILLARGFTSRDISGALNISSHTIDTHRRNLLRKTGAMNSIELIDVSRTLQLI